MDPEVAMAREGRLEGGLTNPSPSPKDSGRSTRRRRRSTTARAPHLHHHHHHHHQQQQHHNDNGDENDENENENIKSRVVGSSLSWLNNLQHDFPFILPTRLDGSQYEGYLRMESSFPHPHPHPHPHVQLEKGEKLMMEERERACSHSHPARYLCSPYLCPATTQGGDLLRPHPHHEEWNHVKMGHEEREMDLFWLCVSDLPKLVGQRWRVSSLEGAELKYGPRLGKLLDHHHAAQRVERRLKESRNPLAFFHELHDIVERTSFTTRRDRPSLPLHTFLAVAEDIKGIRKDHAARSSRLTGAAAAAEEEEDSNGDGNGNEGKKAKNHNHVKGEFTCLSDDLSSLEYKTCDDGGREHVLSIRIPPRYPQSPPQVSAIGLPVEFTTPAQAPAPTPTPTPPTTTKVSSLRERDNITYGGCGEDMTMTSSKPKSNGNSNPIREVVCCFEGLVAALQPFWEAMDAIDSRAWVLEPERPDRSCTYRRILLHHHHVSMLVEFSPLQMESAPFTQVSFLGANEHVAPLEERVRNHTFRPKQGKGKGEDLNLNLNLNPCTLSLNKKKGSNRDLGDVVEHLEEMVGMKLPSRTKESGNTMEETTGMMCGICYSYKINQPHSGAGAGAGANGKNTIQVPEIACENKNCGYLFHRECLLEWLQSDQSSRQTFNTMFGSCPYCSDPIVCKRTM